ncbi:MAG: sulfatase family protein [Solirubrobacteraceae bacterium]
MPTRPTTQPRRLAIAAVLLVLTLLIAACSSDGPSSHTDSAAFGAGSASPTVSSGPVHPNIVFVLTDDLSMDLLRYMPQVRALQRRGLTLDNYFVSDSLCCPSRSSIFTGDFPHDTGVFTNAGRGGGIGAFFAHGDERKTFNVALQRAGYRTAMMGKYLNGYLQGPRRSPVSSRYVPEGWSQWDVAGFAYSEYDYTLNEDGRLRYFGHAPGDYLTSVLARRGAQFIDSSAQAGQPFFLELATFSPHAPYTPAPRDRHSFPGLTAPRPPSFDALPFDAPRWLAGHPALRPKQLRDINRVFRRRAQAVQSVDRLLATIEAAVRANGQAGNTYIVLSSDNGLHTGEYRLMPGKLTAFDTDIHVPLVITGPGVLAGSSSGAMSENVDLAKTFEAIGSTTAPSDGHSLTPLLRGGTPGGWRNAVLVEHHGPAFDRDDPDRQTGQSGNPTTYEAMRTPQFLYVEYRNGQRSFYDLRADPYELHNIIWSLSATRLAQLHSELAGLQNCHSGAACWSASHVSLGGQAALHQWRAAVQEELRLVPNPRLGGQVSQRFGAHIGRALRRAAAGLAHAAP